MFLLWLHYFGDVVLQYSVRVIEISTVFPPLFINIIYECVLHSKSVIIFRLPNVIGLLFSVLLCADLYQNTKLAVSCRLTRLVIPSLCRLIDVDMRPFCNLALAATSLTQV
jgi:hypothetical protein